MNFLELMVFKIGVSFKMLWSNKQQVKGKVPTGPYTRFVLHYLNSEPFLDFLSKLTGIEHLIPDPYFEGGGLHQSCSGGEG